MILDFGSFYKKCTGFCMKSENAFIFVLEHAKVDPFSDQGIVIHLLTMATLRAITCGKAGM